MSLYTIEMKRYAKAEAIATMNERSQRQEPFVFFIDFDLSQVIIETPKTDGVYYDFDGFSHYPEGIDLPEEIYFDKYPISCHDYRIGFDKIIRGLRRGDSYLANLTFPTLVKTNMTMHHIFEHSEALYKGYIPNEFVFYSPERFLDIADGIVSTYPMKGTIDARIIDAMSKVLNDPKEKAEHATIVDLLRNDLSQFSNKVSVSKYRYIDRIKSRDKDLLQVSSEIIGEVKEELRDKIGTVLFAALPAGSVTGAPKKKTIEMIRDAEITDRKYYTGVCGYYDGANLRSGVMIRMIQMDESGEMYYHSGGGITHQSDPKSEYQEMIDKIYVPITRNDQSPRRSDRQHSLSQ